MTHEQFEQIQGFFKSLQVSERFHQEGDTAVAGIRLRRDTWVSVMYFEELNSGESSATF